MMNQIVVQKSRGRQVPSNLLMATLDSPEHCCAYAGYLMADNLPEKAAVYYCRAAEIYLDQGQVLRALVVRLLMWQTLTPQPDEIRLLSSELKKSDIDGHPLLQFMANLEEEIFADLISYMIPDYLPKSQTLIKPGETYHYFYINVSGTLRDSLFLSMEDAQENYRNPTIEIHENDYFGEIYPFDKDAASQSYIEALTPAEVIKIHKKSLQKLCAKYSQFEVGLMKLLNVRKVADNLEPQSLRRTKRLKLGVELDMRIEMVSGEGSPIQLKGFTQDLSVDGICLVLNTDSWQSMKARNISGEIVGETIKIAAGLNYLKVFFSGKIAWWRYISYNGQKTIALGVEFNIVPPNYKGILMSFLNLMRKENGSGASD